MDLSHRSFGWAVLEGSERLVEVGLAYVRSRTNDRLLARVAELRDRFEPDMFVVDEPISTGRGARARHRIEQLVEAAIAADVHVSVVTRDQLHREFQLSGTTKHEIALALVRQFPELEPRLPEKRKAWTSEDENQSVFDAVALALAALRTVEWRK